LIDAITKRQVASGALPISTGAVVQNVGTAFAVYEAVQKNKPLFERVITVTGKSVTKPSNFLARIGTPMKQLPHRRSNRYDLFSQSCSYWREQTKFPT
jgi:electron transport complex protein RnfC